MTKYTPTTGEVRERYGSTAHYFNRTATEFDRWLQSVKAEAWYEGQDSCGDQYPWAENPYETEETV